MSQARLGFEVLARCPRTGARAGLLHTAHGPVPTPTFLPVGTQGSVKSLTPRDLRAAGATCLLANTYHLALRPGAALIERLGGLHAFMGWDGAVLTDSGGFQVLSLADRRTLDDEGVCFRSHLDGRTLRLTPERVVALQEQLGSDIAMVLDECPPYPCDRPAAEAAVARTQRWAERSLRARTRPDQQLFAIVQGSVYPGLRTASARWLAALPFDGYAIGGVSVGEPRADGRRAVAAALAALPAEKPRYLMGVGTPEELLTYVALGVDLFDCVLPTRTARTGALLTRAGRLNLLRAEYRTRAEPPAPGCACPTCAQHSAAYLHHLFRAGEELAFRLASVHNIWFLTDLMRQARAAILAGALPALLERLGLAEPAGR